MLSLLACRPNPTYKPSKWEPGGREWDRAAKKAEKKNRAAEVRRHQEAHATLSKHDTRTDPAAASLHCHVYVAVMVMCHSQPSLPHQLRNVANRALLPSLCHYRLRTSSTASQLQSPGQLASTSRASHSGCHAPSCWGAQTRPSTSQWTGADNQTMQG